MKNTIAINSSEFTTLVNKHITRSKVWEKGTMRRLYISDCSFTSIYNTKKCKQKVYIDLNTFKLVCATDCPDQSNNWEANESERVLNSGLQVVARLLRILCKDRNEVSKTTIEEVIKENELEAQPVNGYYTQWREVRVAINRFGKLAIRNRQFCVSFSGNKSNAPKGFIELSDLAYDFLKNYSKGDYMLEPYAEAPDFEHMAIALNHIVRSN